MRRALKEVADFIKGELVGDKDIIITGVNGIKESNRRLNFSLILNISL